MAKIAGHVCDCAAGDVREKGFMALLRSFCTASLLLAAGFAVPAAAQTAPAQNPGQNGVQAPAAAPPHAADQTPAHSDAQPPAQATETAPEKRFALVIGN